MQLVLIYLKLYISLYIFPWICPFFISLMPISPVLHEYKL